MSTSDTHNPDQGDFKKKSYFADDQGDTVVAATKLDGTPLMMLCVYQLTVMTI